MPAALVRLRLLRPLTVLAVAGAAWATTAVAGAPTAHAVAGGPVVLDGMNPVCHSNLGSDTGGYIRTVLAGVYAGATRANDGSIAVLGAADTDNQCGQTFADAMGGFTSSLTPAPAVHYFGDSTSIGQLFTDIASGTARPRVLWIPDDTGNYAPGSPVAMALTANAGAIADFVHSGGALFSNLNAYGWLTALLPSAVFHWDGCNGGPAVTADGRSRFPGLTDSFVEACWHGYFTGDVDSLRSLVAWPFPSPSDAPVSVAIGGSLVTPGQQPATTANAPTAPHVTVAAQWYSVDVTIRPASTGGSPITGYKITITGPKGSRVVNVGPAGGTVTISNLTARTGFRIAVTARNAVGVSTATVVRATTTAEPPAVPIPALGNRPLAPGQSAVLSGDGLFPLDSATLTAGGRRQLSVLARALRGARAIRCDGYTDLSTAPLASYRLGLARAQRVCSSLASLGVHATQIVRSFGNTRPVVTHGTWRDRAPNRRVVVFVAR